MPHRLALSKTGMVTSPHDLASQAGAHVLASGGNAIEAAITIAACLCVTCPHFSGLGGDAFLIISDAQGSAQTISGIGQAPSTGPLPTAPIPMRGPEALLTTAGTIDALGKAFDLSRSAFSGTKTWAALLEPAIALAQDGFPITTSQRFWLDFRLNEMASLPGVAANYLVDGVTPDPRHIVRQPHLTETLKILAQNGHRDAYEGQLAALFAEGLTRAGSPLTKADLKATQARIEPPLTLPYRGGTLLAHQPPTQGITTLEIMGILERFDMASIPEGSADYYHLLIEAVKRAFIDRNRCVADPDFAPVPVDELLSPAHLDAAASSIRMDHALTWPHVFQTGDTVFIGATDAMGNAVAMLSTIYFDWGSGIEIGETGVLWHNRGASFSVDPSHPNVIAHGKRPFHTLNPGLYLKEGRPCLIYGTQGADGQPQTLAALLTRLIDYKMDPLTALSRPRFLLGKTFSDATDSLKLEEDVGPEIVQSLRDRGHTVALIPAQSPLAGHPGVILIDHMQDVISGAHDPRSDGKAIGV